MKSFRSLILGALFLLLPIVPAKAQQTDFNKRASVSFNTSGSNTVIAGVAGKQICIYGLDLYLASSTTIQLFDNTTALTGAMTTTSYTKQVKSTPCYWTLPAGDSFNITLGSGVQTSGAVWYSQQ